ncbi:pre-rRNA-processing protein TSR1 [Strigomonas culicis]|nr:pre-rRNA-processing protein TSR1 [Strigomonas culicis]|eukprot:EPY19497.1 pre-rRNA-processing protein TSR1 [Strigomonas culicis]
MARNKAHKQRFSSKHAVADKEKGRQVPSTAKRGAKYIAPDDYKQRSKQVALAHRNKRAQDALNRKRFGSNDGVPRIVGVVPANESGNTEDVIQLLCGSLNSEYKGYTAPFTLVSKEKKCSFTFICEKNCNDQDCLDVAKVSDFVVLALDASQSVQQTITEMQNAEVYGEDDNRTIATTWFSDVGLCITDYTRDLIAAINAQGSPNIVVIIQNLHTFTEKQRQKVLKVHQRYFLSVLHETTKVVALNGDEDVSALMRHLQVSKLRELKWRDQHPYLAVEESFYNTDSEQMMICGRLRGMNLSARQLLHLTNHGTFQISKIEKLINNEITVIDESDPMEREPLEHIQPNSTLNDEGFPTEADVEFHEKQGKTSEYEAGETNMSDQLMQGDADEDAKINEDIIDFDAISYRTTQTDLDFLRAEDVIRLERMTDSERLAEIQKLKDNSEDEAWNPDVVDTPVNLPARQRFAKYRGLKSFPNSKWDPAENLPVHYAYIYKLQGFSRIRECALENCNNGVAEVGDFIRITIEKVPQAVYENRGETLLIASGQLEHEQKWSVVHYQVQRCSEFDEPIKSKTPMLAHMGFRKFYVSPLFSDMSSGDRTKFARYFHESDKFRMASFFGPISYSPCPIVLFQVPSLEEQNEGNPLRLACFGGALPPNPDLLLLKRAVLTGRVAVIHKKQIVVKYMFF